MRRMRTTGRCRDVAATADDTHGTPDDEDGVTTLPAITDDVDERAAERGGVEQHRCGGDAGLLAGFQPRRRLPGRRRAGEGDGERERDAADHPLTFTALRRQCGGELPALPVGDGPDEVANPTGAAAPARSKTTRSRLRRRWTTVICRIRAAAPAWVTTTRWRADNGPSHVIVTGVFLGAGVDPDTVTLQTQRHGRRRHNTGLADDEDGVAFLTPLTAGHGTPTSR